MLPRDVQRDAPDSLAKRDILFTPQGSGPRYMAVRKMPSLKHAKRLEESVAEAGWYDYFDHVNAGREINAPQAPADIAQLESTAV